MGFLMNYWDRVVYLFRYLPFELPSRKKDSLLTFAAHSAPYFIVGTAVLILASVISPAARHLLPIWLANVNSLPDWYQKLLHIILTGIWLWCAAYAIGVMTIEKLRYYYRRHLVRPFEKAFRVEL